MWKNPARNCEPNNSESAAVFTSSPLCTTVNWLSTDLTPAIFLASLAACPSVLLLHRSAQRDHSLLHIHLQPPPFTI
jgi:hypothetical protein